MVQKFNDAGWVSFAPRSHATRGDETAAIRTAVTDDGLRSRTSSATNARDRVELDCVALDCVPRVAPQRYRRGCYSQSGWRSTWGYLLTQGRILPASP